MAPRIGFDTARLSEAATSVAEAGDGIEHELDVLEARFNAVRGALDGDAANAYAIAQREWLASLARMRRILDLAAKAIESSSQHYLAARGKAEKSWS